MPKFKIQNTSYGHLKNHESNCQNHFQTSRCPIQGSNQLWFGNFSNFWKVDFRNYNFLFESKLNQSFKIKVEIEKKLT